jgi:phage shock protein A
MKVINRAKKIFSRNWEETVKSFNNPEADMQKALRTMQDVIFELRQAAATRISDAKLLKRHITTLQEGTEKWEENAAMAVGAGQDDLARRALLRKNKISLELEVKNKELNTINREVESLKEEIRTAEHKFNQFYNQSKLMQHNKIFAKTGLQQIQSKIDNIHNLEEKFTQLEINAEQRIHLEKKDIKLEDELADLKNKVAQKNKSNKE